MASIGTPLSDTATRILMCGAGELGKEVVIEFQRLGVEVVAVDRYANAPAMQVAHRSYVVDMRDGAALRRVIEKEKPDLIVPEIEAIATDELLKLEAEGFSIVPTARAVHLTMNREGIRRLVAEELGLPTSPYRFAEVFDEYEQAVEQIGIPCVIKPVMSSSGKGQSTIRDRSDINRAWQRAHDETRGVASKVIIEGLVEFDYEITLLTIRHVDGTSFCLPIGHQQIAGDYRYSWQPQPMTENAWGNAKDTAKKVTDALGGYGVFGVELFIKNNDVLFSEVSPRPHDTGLVTLISQDLSEFALHARAVLGLPIPKIHHHGPSASAALVAGGDSRQIKYNNLEVALSQPDTNLLLFGKPDISGHRRLGVAIARGSDIDIARAKAVTAIESIHIEL